MSRLLILCLASAFFIACGDDAPPVDCDPTYFDCTPVEAPPTCDPERYDCTPTVKPPDGETPIEPAWIPSKDDIRALGAVFPGDEAWLDVSWSADLSGWEEAGYANQAHYVLDRARLFHEHAKCYNYRPPYRSTQCTGEGFYLYEGSATLSAWGQNWDTNFDELTENGFFCLNAGSQFLDSIAENSNPTDPTPIRFFTHIWHWDGVNLSRYAPPTDETGAESWLCLSTPYGAAWLLADVSDEYFFPRDSSFLGVEPAAKVTCHPDVDWLAFTKSNLSSAYTVGTLADAYVPVAGCAPKGSQAK